ncbi:DUF3093 domain-containing protein [Corynebacterium pseudopelargi]|uniref:DUF3093 domain-containing protein n=1 Tax=Corynebacterium pseudopelargi TaxID=2080757 RepID=A0A3G6ITQ8_9CORY|nr:DUF3093 domain-containing protein [Corynebacterium pseudopelargi]AZA09129.1 hypothetical protein CPPEL_05010 [Corynebacterium pseudopelargi]
MSSKQQSSASVLYEERHWVPWYWWLVAAGVVALMTRMLAMNRSAIWLYAPAVLLSALALWILLSFSSTRLRVEQDPDGTRWLTSGEVNLPHTVVSKSLVVPESAKRNAMGRQLDPAAFLISHDWVKEMAMFVLDDPEDPTPYWLVSSKNPAALVQAFVPDQAEAALQASKRS